MRILATLTAAFALAVTLSFATSASAGTLEDVKSRGSLKCIINTGLIGFAFTDANGSVAGL